MHSLTSASSRAEPKRSVPLYALVGALFLMEAFSGCATYDKYRLAAGPDDAQITADIKAQLDQHAELQGPNQVYVQTLNRVVYLSGEVSSGLESRIAESVAMHVQGIDRVENSIALAK